MSCEVKKCSVILTWNVEKLFVWSTLTGQISCAVTAERQAGGGGGGDDTGPQELITLNNGEQIKSNLGRMGEISHWSSESETFVRHKIYLQNLTYIMWGEGEGGEGGCLAFEPVCVYVCACVLYVGGGAAGG